MAAPHAGTADGRDVIEVRNLSKEYASQDGPVQALANLSFAVADAEFVTIVGHSGCGKSTLLKIIAGLLPPSSGEVKVRGRKVGAPLSDVGMVFQRPVLLKWRTILDNVMLPIEMLHLPRKEGTQRALDLLKLAGLTEFRHHYPAQLSGGMQQRVEIARVLINHPRVMLMDEPFGALDAQTRLKMQELLLDVWARVNTTIIFITHDIDEALFLADRILVMSPRPGRIIDEIRLDFERPRHPDVMTSNHFTRLKRHCLDLLHPQASITPLARLSPLGPL